MIRGVPALKKFLTLGVIAGASLLLGACVDDDPLDEIVITDDVFIADANAICGETADRMNAITAPRGVEALEEFVPMTHEMLEQLQALRPDPSSEEAVEEWLGHWEVFVAIGDPMIEAMKADDIERAQEIGNEGDAPATAFNRIARANGLDDCVLIPELDEE